MTSLLFWAALNGFLAVMLGAFGAHGLKNQLSPELMTTYGTAVEYHFYHALGLFLVGLLALQWPNVALIRTSGWVMLAGILLFSGSLYLLVFTGVRWLGAVTPIGGVCFLAAWALLAFAVVRHNPS